MALNVRVLETMQTVSLASMRAKHLSTNNIRFKTLIRHDSKFTIRQVKNLRMRDFNRTILNSIHDNSHYMEGDISIASRHNHIMLKPYS
jgi:hypothetical protein